MDNIDNVLQRSTPAIAVGTVYKYVATKSVQELIVPEDGEYTIQCWGAQGGHRAGITGKTTACGAYVKGTVSLKKGTILHIHVGTHGNNGGWNGGGAQATSGTGGGGASDVRVIVKSQNIGIDTMYNRLIVAGGGGGQGASNSTGGHAGTTSGSAGTGSYGTPGSGGTQTSGYAFGQGAPAVSSSGGYGGAGGGGWYGGTAATPDSSGDDDKGGGGGSSYLFTSSSTKPTGYGLPQQLYLKDTEWYAGGSSVPSKKNDGSKERNVGDGQVIITYTKYVQLTVVNNNEYNFEYTGSPQTFTAPKSGKYRIKCWGAEGGHRNVLYRSGGGYSEGVITLDKGDQLYVYVGGYGGTGNGVSYNGWNGGGKAGYSGIYGGGASDVRVVGGAWNDVSSLRTRIIVAGGSGSCGGPHQQGGYGGGTTGGNGAGNYGSGGTGGTQNSGGTGNDGTFGIGGNGTAANGGYGGAGGGGWYGGGGVTGPDSGDDDKGGGGGSGYVLTNSSTKPLGYRLTNITKYYLTETKMLAGNVTIEDEEGFSFIGKRGNGYVRITLETELTYIPPSKYDEHLFSYTGNVQTFTAPRKGTYKLECWGARGGSRSTDASTIGGAGGYAYGELALEKGDTLYVYVGGYGGTINGVASNGWNGGGKAGYSGIYGGGASDIRVTNGTWNAAASLNSRIIVAGGGGSYGGPYQQGGYGGGTTGGNGQGNYGSGGTGGTQTAGGSGNAGSFGIGGNGTAANGGYGGAGGGGWYGGGGVTSPDSGDDDKGGGGGSGYVLTSSSTKPSGYTVTSKYYLSNTVLTTGGTAMPWIDKFSTYGSLGHGYVRITNLEPIKALVMHANVSGVSKEIKETYINISGTWKKVDKVHVNVDGTWTD